MSDLQLVVEVEDPPARSRDRRMVVALGVGSLLVVLFSVLAVGANSVAGCSLCHSSEASALSSSAHADIDCATCHAASSESVSARLNVVFRMVPKSVVGVRLNGPGRLVGNSACLECHGEVRAEGEIVVGKGLRIDHSACTMGSGCTSCHSTSTHGTATRVVRAPAMAECTGCHLSAGASTACETCHEGEMPTDRVRDPVWVRTHGPQWEEFHGLGDIRTCAVCHEGADCETCHGTGVPHAPDFGGSHGTYALDSGTDKCLSCHKSRTWCEGCHQVEMPHPEGFLQAHSGIAVSKEDPVCSRCHPLEDCKTCHGFHVHPGGAGPPAGKYGGG